MNLGNIAGLVSDYHNKADILIKRVTQLFLVFQFMSMNDKNHYNIVK